MPEGCVTRQGQGSSHTGHPLRTTSSQGKRLTRTDWDRRSIVEEESMASEVAQASESLRRGLVFTPKVEAAVPESVTKK